MKQRVFIVHGWGASPEREWFPWLKDQLQAQDIEVFIPAMPDTNHPTIETWIGTLHEAVGDLRDTDIFVGHSIGCQTILRYLEQEASRPIKGFISVAGWMTLQNLENKEEEEIAKPWLETPIDFDVVRERVQRSIAIFSDNDPYVPLQENMDVFAQQLGAQVIVEHGKGHFSEDSNIFELPIVRDTILAFIHQL